MDKIYREEQAGAGSLSSQSVSDASAPERGEYRYRRIPRTRQRSYCQTSVSQRHPRSLWTSQLRAGRFLSVTNAHGGALMIGGGCYRKRIIRSSQRNAVTPPPPFTRAASAGVPEVKQRLTFFSSYYPRNFSYSHRAQKAHSAQIALFRGSEQLE